MKFQIIIVMFLCLGLSCIRTTKIQHSILFEENLNSRPNIFLKQSFIKIQRKVLEKDDSSCTGEDCKPKIRKVVASGVIIHKVITGSYILSAEHVCTGKSSETSTQIKSFITVFSPSGEGHAARVLWSDFYNDTCVIWVPGMDDGVEVKLSQRKPVYGDRVINLASPLGVAELPHVVPLFEGHYCGSNRGFDMYSIPATGGSSGGPIFDSEGGLIGMIQASLINFPIISLSARYNDITTIVRMVRDGRLKVEQSDDKSWRQSLPNL